MSNRGMHCVRCAGTINLMYIRLLTVQQKKRKKKRFSVYVHTILSVNRVKRAKSKVSEHYVDVHVDYVIADFSLRFYRTPLTQLKHIHT